MAASLGVGTLGAVSLPFMSSDDALVKVASETITDQNFYAHFFELVAHYLDPAQEIPKGGYDEMPAPPQPILLRPPS